MLVSLYEEGICKTQYDLWYNIPNIINIDKKHFVSLLKEMMQNQMGHIKHIHDNNEFKSLLALENLLTGINFGPMIEILSVLTFPMRILLRIP